jgi:cyclophilin family peptidyl-prolyl cis-trans isomerase
MKKLLTFIITLGLVLTLSACSQPSASKNTISDPITDPVGHTQDMINLKDKAAESINNSVQQENARLNDTLNETDNSTNQNNMDYVKNFTGALIKTSLGDIQVKLNNDATPNTVNNFLKLASEKFYDGTKFHRVIKGFMIQGGDPLSKNNTQKSAWGTGGPGYKFADELTGKETYSQGTLAMANSGPNTNGSQFFIMTGTSVNLPPAYTVFGKVVSGIDVALKIENVKTSANDQPLEDVSITSIEPVK